MSYAPSPLSSRKTSCIIPADKLYFRPAYRPRRDSWPKEVVGNLSFGNNVFAFGPDGRYLFESKTVRCSQGLSGRLQDLLHSDTHTEVYAAAFGEGSTYFISHSRKDDFYTSRDTESKEFKYVIDSSQAREWAEVPKRLENWLQKHRVDPRVAFGPANSFFAWDESGCCWQDLPNELESIVQEWLGNSGGALRCPQLVSLGYHDSFVAISHSGIIKHKLDVSYATLGARLNLGPRLRASANPPYSIWLNPFQGNSWALVANESGFFCSQHMFAKELELDLAEVGNSIKFPDSIGTMRSLFNDFKKQNTSLFVMNTELLMHELGEATQALKMVEQREAAKIATAETQAERRGEEEAYRKAEERVKEKVAEIEKEEAERKATEKVEIEARKMAEREAKEEFERETRVKVESEFRERFEREAREKAEKEAKERIEREAMEKIEKEVRDMAQEEDKKEFEMELREKLEREIRERVEREVREQFEREVQEKLDGEEQEKAAREMQEPRSARARKHVELNKTAIKNSLRALGVNLRKSTKEPGHAPGILEVATE